MYMHVHVCAIHAQLTCTCCLILYVSYTIYVHVHVHVIRYTGYFAMRKFLPFSSPALTGEFLSREFCSALMITLYIEPMAIFGYRMDKDLLCEVLQGYMYMHM